MREGFKISGKEYKHLSDYKTRFGEVYALFYSESGAKFELCKINEDSSWNISYGFVDMCEAIGKAIDLGCEL